MTARKRCEKGMEKSMPFFFDYYYSFRKRKMTDPIVQ
jgi:hypothetical protein